MAEDAFTPAFVEGFVADCYRRGLTLDETETQFRKYANTMFLASPNVHEGFRAGLNKAAEYGLSKATMARYLGPDVLALAVDCRVKYGSDALSEVMRSLMGLPEPSWETVAAPLFKSASGVARQVAGFQALPMQQQMLISALVGGGLGGLKRMALPDASDKMKGRGLVNRTIRGVVRGGATGAGAAGGAALGKSVTGPNNPLMGSLAGGAAGALAGNELGKAVVG